MHPVGYTAFAAHPFGSRDFLWRKVFNELWGCYFDSEAPELEQSILFLEFEYILGISVALVLLLMLVFYVIYPFDKDLKE